MLHVVFQRGLEKSVDLEHFRVNVAPLAFPARKRFQKDPDTFYKSIKKELCLHASKDVNGVCKQFVIDPNSDAEWWKQQVDIEHAVALGNNEIEEG